MNNKFQRGFTVIELMVVVAIGMALTAVAAPMMANWLPDQRLQASERNLQSAIQLARLECVRLNTEICAEFDLINNEVLLCVEANRDGFCSPAQGDRLFKTIQMAPDVDFYNETIGVVGQTYVHFNSRGIPSGNGQLHLRNNQGKYRGINIGLTGNSKMVRSDDGVVWY
jgi:prepilin-type N-terminal cleavage/methylation domain-containing protein